MYLDKPFLSSLPLRIVSVVPSQTELLHYLELENETIAITKFCIHPDEWFRNKKRIGGTKNLQVDEIIKLKPDLIIANKEENVKEQIDTLAEHFPVWLTDVNNYDDAIKMIADIGSLTFRENKAGSLIQKIESEFVDVYVRKIKTAYLIWKDPYMTIGGDTFIHDMMEKAGFENVYRHKKRYPQITIDDLKKSDCELILLSSEPYPFKQKHAEELQIQLPSVKIVTADGEMFSWYGSRMLYAPSYFKELQMKHNTTGADV